MELLDHMVSLECTLFERKTDGEIYSNDESNQSNSSYNEFLETPGDSSQRGCDQDPPQVVSGLSQATDTSTAAQMYSDGG